MKYLILLIAPVFVIASGTKLTISEYNSIHGYNHRPSVKLQKKNNMHKLHKIDEKTVKNIVQRETNEEVTRLKLFNRSKFLLYDTYTKNYRLEINAMDGSIINKQDRKEY